MQPYCRVVSLRNHRVYFENGNKFNIWGSKVSSKVLFVCNRLMDLKRCLVELSAMFFAHLCRWCLFILAFYLGPVSICVVQFFECAFLLFYIFVCFFALLCAFLLYLRSSFAYLPNKSASKCMRNNSGWHMQSFCKLLTHRLLVIEWLFGLSIYHTKCKYTAT